MYYDVDYSDVVPVKRKALEQTDQENYSSLLMEDKGFSVTALARLHNLLTHTAVQCFSMLLVRDSSVISLRLVTVACTPHCGCRMNICYCSRSYAEQQNQVGPTAI